MSVPDRFKFKGLHFKTEEEFREKVILLYKGMGAYNQEQEDVYIKELHDKGELSNRELLMAIYKKLLSKHVSVQSSQSPKKVRLIRPRLLFTRYPTDVITSRLK